MASFAAPGRPPALRDFRSDEDGSIMVLSLFFLAIMVLIGGMAVDLMRIENRRVALSQALDTCTLSAASMRQVLDPEAVVRDCMSRQGLLTSLTSVSVTNTVTERAVSATGRVTEDTMFMHALGQDTLSVAATSRARQSATPIEIVLALDVSASMASNQRIEGLRAAAKSFVSRVLAGNSGLVSISIVPYNQQVNIGPDLASRFNVINAPRNIGISGNGNMANVNCVILPSSTYTQVGLSPSTAVSSTGYVDLLTSVFGPMLANSFYTTARTPVLANTVCPQDTPNFIRLPSDDISSLHNQIDALVPTGQTSINLGMKWAGIMLDPQTRPVFNALVTAEKIPANFRDRPLDYNITGALKIVVLMTDGENTPESVMNSAFLSGMSPIFRGTDGNFSIRHTTGRPSSAGSNEFWVPHRNEWRSTSWGGTDSTQGVQLSWHDAWQRLSVAWTSWQLYARALGTTSTQRESIFNSTLANFRTVRGTSTTVNGVTTSSTPAMDTELSQICTATKSRGVLIYGIAFSAPSRGITTIQNCASGAGYFFNSTSNAALNAAFQAIAINITQLRLTN